MTTRSIIFALGSFLIATGAGAADKAAAVDAKDPNKVICKREAPIGSLVASKKVCMTRAEWAAQAVQAQADTRKMQETSGGPQ